MLSLVTGESQLPEVRLDLKLSCTKLSCKFESLNFPIARWLGARKLSTRE